MEEKELRSKACEWLKELYKSYPFLLPLIVFHDEHKTITDYVVRKFKGNKLSSIPKYQSLTIQPDIIGVVVLSELERINGWIIGECKIGEVSVGDIRQVTHYAQMATAYEAFLFCDGYLSKDVEKIVSDGAHMHKGMNIRGKIVEKRLIIVGHVNNRFSRILVRKRKTYSII